MKPLTGKSVLIVALFAGSLLASCKNRTRNQATTDTTTTTAPPAVDTISAPVDLATDEALQNAVRHATKDYPGVEASVQNGEITLNGSIRREQLPQLMSALDALHPKKVNNNLNVQ